MSLNVADEPDSSYHTNFFLGSGLPVSNKEIGETDFLQDIFRRFFEGRQYFSFHSVSIGRRVFGVNKCWVNGVAFLASRLTL